MENDTKIKDHGILLIVTVILVVVAGTIAGYFYFFYVPDLSLPMTEPSSLQRRRLRVAGSETAASAFKILTSGYLKTGKVDFEFLSSADDELGIFGVKDQLIDIGLTAQIEEPVDEHVEESVEGHVDEHIDEHVEKPDLMFTPFAQDALVFAVNSQVDVSKLTGTQLTGIYTGKITNWLELGGADADIVVVDRNESDSGKQLLVKFYLKGEQTVLRAKEVHSEADMLRTLTETPGSIGYLSKTLVKDGNIRQLDIDGAKLDEDYDLMRTLYLVTWKEPSNIIKDVLSYLQAADETELLQLGFFSNK